MIDINKYSLIRRLKELLAIPSVTGTEGLLVDFLVALLTKKGVTVDVDAMGNIMATKGTCTPSEYWPCLVAHTDTVHSIDGAIEIREVMRENYMGETKLALTGFKPSTDEPRGCGGDDKSGVYICLDIMDQLDSVKVFFPVMEETGCHGSQAAPAEWFNDVGYFIQFDSPHGDTMSKSLRGTDIYQEDGEFYRLIGEHLEYITPKRHPYTDVATLGTRFDVECLNLPAGYYKYHCPDEYVVVEDVINGIELGMAVIADLGSKRYEYKKHTSIPNFITKKYKYVQSDLESQ